jgi:ribokinase
MPAPQIIVVGSLNMDLVGKAEKLPAVGQTVLGDSFSLIPGGKGANQAVAAARLGSSVAMIGRLGADSFGDILQENLEKAGINTAFVRRTEGISSGTALIFVDEEGNNKLMAIPGANGTVSREDIDIADGLFRSAKIVMLQLEIPLDTVFYALQKAKEYGLITILDPAPAADLPRPMMEAVDVLTPNESEAEILIKAEVTLENKEVAASKLLSLGAGSVLLTLGRNGVYFKDRSQEGHIQGLTDIRSIDSTAAGDAFNGALAVALTEGKDLAEAVEFANFAGALSTTRLGAQTSLPTREELRAFTARYA